MRRQDGWTKQSPSWYQRDWQSSKACGSKEPEVTKSGAVGPLGHSGLTAETGGASSSTRDKRSQYSGGKKPKSQALAVNEGKF